MASVLFLATSEAKRDLVRGWLREAGVQAEVSSDVAGLSTMTKGNAPEVLAVDAPSLGGAGVETALNTAKSLGVPGFALLGVDDLDNHRLLAQLADFTLEPARPLEFIARLLRLLRQNNGDESRQVVRVGDLVIDAERYEVRVAGEIKLLTYKEYELLRLLASSPGRVFTREELLSRVWGYDYFGGTRTVDVHVRRLRSKIEGVNQSFVETIRNVGYRFRAPDS